MNIYVGNLSYSVTSDDLQKAFEQFGEVSTANVVTDKFTGQSKGFGFVEMTNKAQGDAAIKELDGTDLKGRSIRVNEARPRTEGSSSGGPRRGGPGGGPGGGGPGGGRGRF
ncbi:MAG: RNA-binding protein [Proteobacteria bacterium]|nr:RNA-binding protein [Pseudomonadota bacterium]